MARRFQLSLTVHICNQKGLALEYNNTQCGALATEHSDSDYLTPNPNHGPRFNFQHAATLYRRPHDAETVQLQSDPNNSKPNEYMVTWYC